MPSRPARSRHQSIAPCSTIQRSSTPCSRIFRSSASANRARSPTLSLSSPHPKLITSPELPCLSTVACFGIITSSSRSAVLLVAFLSPTEKCRRLRIVKELVEGAVVKAPAFGADVVALRIEKSWIAVVFGEVNEREIILPGERAKLLVVNFACRARDAGLSRPANHCPRAAHS